MAAEFWLDKPSVLFTAENFLDIIPTDNMSLVEKLNAIARLSVYLGVGITLLSGDKTYLLIVPVVMGITVFLYKRQADKVENFFVAYQNTRNPFYTFPTVNNPLMNFDNIGDPRDKPPAVRSFNKPVVQEAIEDTFNERLYRDAGDLFHKANNQRQFYTMPNTTAVPDTTAFAKWLYSTDATCKEDGIKCAPYYDPQGAV